MSLPTQDKGLVSPSTLAFDDEGCGVGRTRLLKHAAGREADADRLDLMLGIAFRRRLTRAAFRQFLAAVEDSRHGDQVLANLRLALSGLSQIPDVHDLPERIAKTEMLLGGGMEPDDLLVALDLGEDEADLRKYDPAQPRVPAGSGRESGRWTNGSGGAASSAPAIALRAAPILDASFGPLALRAAAAFFGGLGFGTAFGLLVVPSPNSVSTSGPMPGEAGQTYSYDQPTGVLRVLDSAGQVLAAGARDVSGVFADADTGVPFARALDGSIVFGSAALSVTADANDDARSEPRSAVRVDVDENEPKLCPDPGPDHPGWEGASPRAKAYQTQISAMVNPHRPPLPPGIVPALVNPATGDLVHYDECDEKTGDMIDAKGPGFDGVLSFYPGAPNVEDRWLKQSYSQIQAAGSRQVIWYFAEQNAADHARELFAREGRGREKITIKVQPANVL